MKRDSKKEDAIFDAARWAGIGPFIRPGNLDAALKELSRFVDRLPALATELSQRIQFGISIRPRPGEMAHYANLWTAPSYGDDWMVATEAAKDVRAHNLRVARERLKARGFVLPPERRAFAVDGTRDRKPTGDWLMANSAYKISPTGSWFGTVSPWQFATSATVGHFNGGGI